MALYDCFPFFNELDILELRLRELAPLVDRFVLAEATTTFSGDPKPLYFHENRERFAPFLSKIVHVVVDDIPRGIDAWDAEAFQRNAVARGLKDAAPDDLILLSDVDEIPFPKHVARMRDEAQAACVWFVEHDYREYKLNWAVLDKWVGLCATRAVKKRYLPPMQEFRAIRARQSRRLPWSVNQTINLVKNTKRFGAPLPHVLIEHGGWHFTYMSNAETIQHKIKSYAHQERNTPEFNTLENIEKLIRDRKSICGRDMVRVDDSELPASVRSDPARWAHLLG